MQITGGLAKKNFTFIFLSVAVICGASLCLVGGVRTICAQSAVEEQIVVTGEEVPSAYGASPGFSRSRFSNLTNAYVSSLKKSKWARDWPNDRVEADKQYALGCLTAVWLHG
jgi:hypothetical protein